MMLQFINLRALYKNPQKRKKVKRKLEIIPEEELSLNELSDSDKNLI